MVSDGTLDSSIQFASDVAKLRVALLNRTQVIAELLERQFFTWLVESVELPLFLCRKDCQVSLFTWVAPDCS